MSENFVPPTAEQDRRNFAKAFPTESGQIEAAIRGVKATSKSEREQQLIDDTYEMHTDARELGIRPASVVNIWPVDLHSTGPLVAHHIIPACPIGQEFKRYVIEAYGLDGNVLAVDIADKGGRFSPKPVWPITIAKDILQQHSQSNTLIQHGLVIYMGDHAPNKENLAAINDSRTKMVEHMRRRVDSVNLDYLQKKKSNVANDIDRMMVEYLVYHRYMSDKQRPGWMATSRGPEDIIDSCKACGAEPERGAFQCAKCGWIVSPEAAYEAGAVTLLEDDGETANVAGIRVLARLSREKLEEMGISHHVKVTDFERKEAEKKVPKKK